MKRVTEPKTKVVIGFVGKYVDLVESYKSLNEALIHGGIGNDCRVDLTHIDSEEIEKRGADGAARSIDGILVAPGFGSRGIEGKIEAVRYAREQQGAVLRHLPRHADGGHRVRAQRVRASRARTRPSSIRPRRTRWSTSCPSSANVTEKGATMRLGAYPCVLTPGTKAAEAYGATEISERHRHRYEVNNDYRDALERNGMVLSGAVARPPAGRDDRAARSTRTSSAASSTPSSSRRPRRRTRCSSRFVKARASTNKARRETP